jgi:hypothetical protein
MEPFTADLVLFFPRTGRANYIASGARTKATIGAEFPQLAVPSFLSLPSTHPKASFA